MEHKYIESVGTFECVTEKPEAGWFGESKEKKTPFIRIPVKVLEGPCAGQRGTYNGWLSEGAFDNTIARLTEVFGFDGDLNALHAGKTSLAGKRCSVTTESETYTKDGKPKTIVKIQWINPPGGGAPKPMEEGKVQSLLSKLTAKAKAIAKHTHAGIADGTIAPAAPPAAPAEAPADDDVPF